jgi:hypothetical protein
MMSMMPMPAMQHCAGLATVLPYYQCSRQALLTRFTNFLSL